MCFSEFVCDITVLIPLTISQSRIRMLTSIIIVVFSHHRSVDNITTSCHQAETAVAARISLENSWQQQVQPVGGAVGGQGGGRLSHRSGHPAGATLAQESQKDVGVEI